MRGDHDSIRAVSWEHGALQLLDQRLLPTQEQYLRLDDSAAVAAAIRQMVVRGAPAIGISAGYAAVLAARDRFAENAADWRTGFEQDLAVVQQARPTAVNLHWAIERMRERLATLDQLDPVPAVQPKQWRAVRIARDRRASTSKSRMCRGACASTGISSIWLKSQSNRRPSQPTDTVFRHITPAAAVGLKVSTSVCM